MEGAPSTGIPPSACRRIASICASVYLLVFIQNLLMHLAEKILLMQPLTFRADYLRTPSGRNEHLARHKCATRPTLFVNAAAAQTAKFL
ncbi:MAG: hypothetical protein CFE34_03210 [Rhodobacteraceae bacterium PARR1]|nr:MAG: hypothetical protein CFE34_03210 [Rhodobacteraceae bacterium PARR1]